MSGGDQFWNESDMAHVFMLFNTELRAVWAARWMMLNRRERTMELFPYLRPNHRLTSFWIRRTDGVPEGTV